VLPSAQMPTVCDERVYLLKQCASMMLVYTNASIVWQNLTDGLNSMEYRQSRQNREVARIEVELARYQLERHEEMHRCFLRELA
jgi:hypothetical protein